MTQLSVTTLKNKLILVLTSCFFALISTIITTKISNEYYTHFPFHYDSATYLYLALKTYHSIQLDGIFSSLNNIIHSKDSLDVFFRALLYPYSLTKLYGHMYVLFPYMVIFLFLLQYYIYKKTTSYTLAFAAVLSLYIFSFVYSPFLGIADYWKDNLGIWLLGSSLLCLLLSDGLKIHSWALSAGLFLGLLFFQRSALAVYLSAALTPLITFFWYRLFLKHGFIKSCIELSYFVLPALLFLLMLITLQAETLYKYYFVAGYSYATHWDAFKFIIMVIKQYAFFPIITLTILSVINLFYFSNKKQKDVFIGVYYITSFIIIITLFKGLYNQVANVLWILTVILFSTSLIRYQKTERKVKLLLIAFYYVLFLSWGIYQYTFFFNIPGYYTPALKGKNKLYFSVYNTCQKLHCKNISFLSHSAAVKFIDQLHFLRNIEFFNKNNIKLIGYIAQHDSYFKFHFHLKNYDPYLLAQKNISNLQKKSNVIAITYCSKDEAIKSPAFGLDAKTIALPYAIANMQILQNSHQWQFIQNLNSIYGCLAVYWHR